MGNKLDKPDFEQLSKETKFSTEELARWYKIYKNSIPDAQMTQTHFKSLYAMTYNSEGDASDLCEHVFRRYDKDGNGVIDFREFMTTLSVSSRGSVAEKLQWVFNIYDIDGNGYLSKEEVVKVLTAIYKSRNEENPVEMAKKTTKEVFAQVDDNKDGRISEEEFVRHAGNSVMEMLLVDEF